MANRQVNVQLSEEARDILEAAAFVRDVRSHQELLRPVIEGFASELANDPAVASALRLRLEERKKKVSPIESARRKRS